MSHRRLIGVAAATLGATATLATPAAAASPAVTSLKATQKGNAVTVTVKTRNFTIDTKNVGKKPKANRGHQHFQMDGGKYDFPKYSGANGKLAVKLGVAGTYSPAVKPTITYRNLPKGKHTLKVFLAGNNHENGKSARIIFTVR